LKKCKKLQLQDNKQPAEEVIVSDQDDKEDNDGEEQDKVEELIKTKQENAKKNVRQRSSVSAEAYGQFNKKKEFVGKVIKKTKEQMKRINDIVKKSFIFTSLDEKEINTVIDCLEEVKYKSGINVITQGERGDVLYIIESGNLDCYKTFKKEEGPKFLKTYNPGESFGELALLYNAPRAATVKTKNDCIMWTIDRETFNGVVKDAAMKKREKYEKFLKDVDIFSTIDAYEVGQIADALKVENFSQGSLIIKQGDVGDRFYLLEEGKAVAYKALGQKQEKVKEYEKGMYFGELALIKNEPRAASINCETDCKLISLDRLSFKRLLGPIENLLSRNSEKYIKYINK